VFTAACRGAFAVAKITGDVVNRDRLLQRTPDQDVNVIPFHVLRRIVSELLLR
jgi:hypothetical protein